MSKPSDEAVAVVEKWAESRDGLAALDEFSLAPMTAAGWGSLRMSMARFADAQRDAVLDEVVRAIGDGMAVTSHPRQLAIRIVERMRR